MTRVFLACVLCLALLSPAAAQTPRPGPAPAPPPAGESPTSPAPPAKGRREPAPEAAAPGQPVNIRFDITIIDEGGPQPSRKALSLTTVDRQSGQLRASVFVPPVGDVPLALDAYPILERDGKIRARITLDYRPNPGSDVKQAPAMTASIRLSFGVVLENGKKILAAQAADPVTDRRVSVEVTATVLR